MSLQPGLVLTANYRDCMCIRDACWQKSGVITCITVSNLIVGKPSTKYMHNSVTGLRSSH